MLSRFLSAKEQTEVVQGVKDGTVDIVIGTHRLLSDDMQFKDLGLLVVDEEQRFGVQHKERIKGMRTSVDILTLTATPIPRTLEMSLTGIRDLSLVNTPPEDRQPILTYVGEHDPRAVSEAIRRELLREGQVLYVHNRVKDIEHIAADVRRAGSRSAGRGRARSDGRGPARAGRAEVLGARVRRARVHHDRRERSRHADGEHAWSSTAPTGSGSRSSTSCAGVSVVAASARTRTCCIRATTSSRRRRTNG